MSSRPVGTVRQSQVITTYGPGSLVDLPKYSVIVAGLDTWRPAKDREVIEPRLATKIQGMTGVPFPRLYTPPPETGRARRGPNKRSYVGVRRFPEWFVVQSPDRTDGAGSGRPQATSRRLVHLRELDGNRFEKKPVVATRFVRACSRGHIDDLDWHRFVHREATTCRQALWLDELGESGDLADLSVRCECGKRRALSDAGEWNDNPLGNCGGKRPWLGKYATEDCSEQSRLLIRTASNAYFSQVVRVLSIPDQEMPIKKVIDSEWTIFQGVRSKGDLETLNIIPAVRRVREDFGDELTFKAIQAKRTGETDDRGPKQVELDAFLAAPEGFGDDVPVNPDYHARRLPRRFWKRSEASSGIDAVVQLHRLREVSALIGFTRLDAALPDIDGEFETDVTRAELDEDPKWFPAVENRGEGIFLSLRSDAVARWLERLSVEERIRNLEQGHAAWLASRKKQTPTFPGGTYVLLHTLSHLLMQSMALRCGYPATSIRERIYLDPQRERYGLLLYTASPDAEGTLGGLVQQARNIEEHLSVALRMGELCSSDPICGQHAPASSPEHRWLHGAACHSCALVSETSCEMRNEYLDRSLVVPTVGDTDAAFFQRPA